MEKTKKLAVILVFALVIFVLAIAGLLLKDKEISLWERRRLEKLPEFNSESVFSSEYSQDLEKYLLDHFPLRDSFRTLKAITNKDVFLLRDNNNLYSYMGGIYKQEYPLKENQVLLAAKKFEEICAAYPQIGKAYYSVIPDKNYFTAAENGYPSIDYAKLMSLLRDNVKTPEYIDIFPLLSVQDYYTTDTHWSQDKILPVAESLCQVMGVPFAGEDSFEKHSLSPFYGVLYGQAALPVKPDEMVYLTNAATENAVVSSAEHTEPMKVYNADDFNGTDPYDLFLSGAEAVITIENPNAKTEKTLVIFRDSFGSSIAPLLIDSYSKITLVDLRYIISGLLDDYVDFENADVLFLYSTLLINSAGLLK